VNILSSLFEQTQKPYPLPIVLISKKSRLFLQPSGSRQISTNDFEFQLGNNLPTPMLMAYSTSISIFEYLRARHTATVKQKIPSQPSKIAIFACTGPAIIDETTAGIL
jgi:hypothetical protein